MSELSLQAAVAAALAPLYLEGSVLVNDYRTPQTASRDRSPWAILAVADEVIVQPGESWSTPTLQYGIYLTLLDYRRGRSDKALLDAFQAQRQRVLTALLGMAAGTVRRVEASTPLAPYFTQESEPDPDSVAQRLVLDVIEYEV